MEVKTAVLHADQWQKQQFDLKSVANFKWPKINFKIDGPILSNLGIFYIIIFTGTQTFFTCSVLIKIVLS